MSETTKGRIPEIGEYVRMFGILVEIQDVTPPPPPVPEMDYIFEDTTAVVELRASGHKIKEGSTFNNFYGNGTCVESAIKQAKELAAHYGDGVEVRVVKVTSRSRMRPSRDEHFYDREFVEFRPLERGSQWDLPDPVEEVVWTSSEPNQKSQETDHA